MKLKIKEIEIGLTINLGGYESFKPSVRLEVSEQEFNKATFKTDIVEPIKEAFKAIASSLKENEGDQNEWALKRLEEYIIYLKKALIETTNEEVQLNALKDVTGALFIIEKTIEQMNRLNRRLEQAFDSLAVFMDHNKLPEGFRYVLNKTSYDKNYTGGVLNRKKILLVESYSEDKPAVKAKSLHEIERINRDGP